jgi:nucleoside phosphorylase
MSLRNDDFGLWLINFDPERPQAQFFATATEAMLAAQQMVPAVPVPWPAKWSPRPDPLAAAPAEDAPLPRRDVLIVTWTVGEARTLAKLLTGDNYDDWYQYRHNLDTFVPKVTGPRAPFNTKKLVRYYHSLGLYFPARIGNVPVLAYKSGLHMAYDGPAIPVVDLWKQIIAEVQPKVVITTGTGGGIGSDVLLGDVVIAAATRFHLTGSVMGSKPFHDTSYPTSQVDIAAVRSLVTQDLLKPNGDRLQDPRIPMMIYPDADAANIVSTNGFAFDDSTNYFKLQGLGKCCDMGDATLGLAVGTGNGISWHAIRNASDPQILNSNNDISSAAATAKTIYGQYQLVTTAGSVVASWAVVASLFPEQALRQPEMALLAKVPTPPAEPPETAESILLTLTASPSFTRVDVDMGRVPKLTLDALKKRLQEENVNFDSSQFGAAEITFTDPLKTTHVLYYIEVNNTDAEEFAAVYVISAALIVAKFETVSS